MFVPVDETTKEGEKEVKEGEEEAKWTIVAESVAAGSARSAARSSAVQTGRVMSPEEANKTSGKRQTENLINPPVKC